MQKKKIYMAGMAIFLGLSLFWQGCGIETAGQSSETKSEIVNDVVSSKKKPSKPKDTAKPTKVPDKKSEKDTAKSDTAKTDIAFPSSSGALHVEGTKLIDSNDNVVQLKGISTHGLSWFPDYVNKECFQQLREEWNVNVIRLAMYTEEYGGYCSGGDKEALKKLIKDGVTYATELDMYVIIDWHILSDNNPNTHKKEAKTFFAEMAKQYAEYDNVLYEICNEPNGGTSWSDIKSYAKEVISAIRKYDKDGIIIVGTPNWSQYVDQAAADPITGYDNIMYTLHFYAATHTDSLRNTMAAAIKEKLPIFVTEYGICDASGNGAIDEKQANEWVNIMNEYDVSYVAWNLSNKNETSAILNSSCSKTSDFTDSDLSASGKWLYHMLTGETAPTTSKKENENSKKPTDKDTSTTTSEKQKEDSKKPTQDQSSTSTISLSNGDISFTAQLKNSWESDKKYFYQYELTLENISDKNCDTWEIDIPFNHTITLSDGWNGNYSVSGKTLHITSKDYNGSISSGSSIHNIGFIVSASKKLKIAE